MSKNKIFKNLLIFGVLCIIAAFVGCGTMVDSLSTKIFGVDVTTTPEL